MRYVLRRAGFFLLTLWAAVTLNFFLPRMMPGNPAIAMMVKFRGRISWPALTSLETIFGVNTHESLPVQYVHYLGDIATGNFGTSLFFFPSPVSQVVHKAMAKQPWSRFSSAKEFGEALEKALRNEPLAYFDSSA